MDPARHLRLHIEVRRSGSERSRPADPVLMGESGSSAGRGRRIRLTGVAAVFVFTIGAFASGVHTAGVEDMATQSVFAWILKNVKYLPYYYGKFFPFLH